MAIELIVLDVDGTLTDGKIYYTANEDEIKAFDVKDGLAIASWIRLGRKVAIITGRHSSIVARRSQELGIEYLYQGIKDKKECLNTILKKEGLTLKQTSAIGDDLNDWGMLKSVALSYAPSDAVLEIRQNVDMVLDAKGGFGAVRKMIEDLLKREGLWEEYLRLWSVE